MNFESKPGKYHLLVLCAVILVVFANTLFNGFVWDDKILFLSDPVIQEFRLREIFFSLAGGFEYTPFVTLFMAIEYAFWGKNPFGYHLINLVLYLFTILLVYRLTPKLLRIVFKDTKKPEETSRIALAATLMFAVHPLHAEVVAWICANNILLSGILFLLSCSFYIDWLHGNRKMSERPYAASILFFFFAAASKASVIVLPLLLLLFLVFNDEKKSLAKYLHLVPFFTVSVLFFFIHKNVAIYGGRVNEHSIAFETSSIISKIAVAVQIPFFYINKFFLPFGLNISYNQEFHSPLLSFPVVASTTGVCMVVSLALALRKKHPEILFGLGWFLATMLPVLNFFSTEPIVADRYFYLPLFGLVFIIAVLSGKNRRSTFIVAALFCIFWSAASIKQNSRWKSNETLWSHALKTSGSVKAYTGLAEELMNQGQFEKALDVVAGLKNSGVQTDIYSYHLGAVLGNRGDFTGALSVLENSYSRNSKWPAFLFLLAETYEKAGNKDSAIKLYNETITLSKGFIAYSLGRSSSEALARLTHGASSPVDIMRSDVVLHPADKKMRNMLAMQLDHLGFYNEALKHYLELERQGEQDWKLFFNIGNVYNKIKRSDLAIKYHKKSLDLNPDYLDTINNIGNAYENMEQYDKAIQYYNLALRKEPKYPFAPFNLALLYFKIGDRANALKFFNHTIERFPQLREKTEPYMKKLQ